MPLCCQQGPRVHRQVVFGLALVLSAVASSGCGEKPTIHLESPMRPSGPSPGQNKPSLPTDPLPDDEGGGMEPGGPPGGMPPPARLYRALCVERHYSHSLSTVTSMTPPHERVAWLYPFDVSTGETRRDHGSNIGLLSGPVIAGVPGPGRLKVLFSGTNWKRPTESRNSIYHGEIDLATRSGDVEPIAPVVEGDGRAKILASRLGLELRNHGASSQGRYLVIPRKRGFQILTAADRQERATLSLDPRLHFFPEYDEESQILSLFVFLPERRVFAQRFYRLDLADETALRQRGPVKPQSLGPPEPPPNMTTLPARNWGDGGWAWARIGLSQIESDGLDLSFLEFVLVERDGQASEKSGRAPEVLRAARDLQATRDGALPGYRTRTLRYVAPPGYRLAPSFAVLAPTESRVLGEAMRQIVVAQEKISQSDGMSEKGASGHERKKAWVHDARLLWLRVGPETVSIDQIEQEVPYPPISVQSIEERGLRTSFAASGLYSSPDLAQLFAVLPLDGAPHLFTRIFTRKGDELRELGAMSCDTPSLTMEAQ